MAISVNPMTYVIHVPQADLTYIGGIIYELNINTFRIWLKDWEDDDDNMPMLKTHTHNTEVTLSGLTYARIVEILPPYTVEFEDGQYTVNCTGANHNLADVRVANQVALIINNAAGLINMPAIEYASFDGGVTVDVSNGIPGVLYNIGTPANPVDNMPNALSIAEYRGLTTFYVIGDITLNDSIDFEERIFVGESKTKSTITIASNANVENCEFYDAHIAGILDGGNVLKSCLIESLNYVNGFIEQCVLETGTVTLGGSGEAHFLDCWSGVAGGVTPIIDMGTSGQDLALRNYNGDIKITNLSGDQDIVIDLNSGIVELDSTISAGTITVRGVGLITDNTTGTATVDISGLVNPTSLASEVWNHSDGVMLLKLIKNKKTLEKNGSVWELIIYDNDNSTPILNKVLKDSVGNDITDPYAGVLAQEFKTSI